MKQDKLDSSSFNELKGLYMQKLSNTTIKSSHRIFNMNHAEHPERFNLKAPPFKKKSTHSKILIMRSITRQQHLHPHNPVFSISIMAIRGLSDECRWHASD